MTIRFDDEDDDEDAPESKKEESPTSLMEKALFEARTVAAFAARVDEVSRSVTEREEIEL